MPGYIDAHVHLWDPGVLRYDWLADAGLDAPHTLETYRAATADDPPDRYLFVQAGAADADGAAEARWVDDMCRADPAFAGMVVWAPVDDGGDAVRALLDALVADGIDTVRGVRRLIQGDPPGLCPQPGFVDGVTALAARNLTFDVCIFPHHLADAAELAARAPDTRLVLDHLAKPDIAGDGFDEWHGGIAALAAHDNVWCKLSGIVTEADHSSWTVDGLRLYVEAALDAFGPDRMLWGSDWPVVTLAATHLAWREATDELLCGLSPEEQRAVRSGTARTVYGLGEAGDGSGDG